MTTFTMEPTQHKFVVWMNARSAFSNIKIDRQALMIMWEVRVMNWNDIIWKQVGQGILEQNDSSIV